MTFSVAEGLESSLTMLKSSLLLLELGSMRTARPLLFVFFRSRWYWLRAVLSAAQSMGSMIMGTLSAVVVQWMVSLWMIAIPHPCLLVLVCSLVAFGRS